MKYTTKNESGFQIAKPGRYLCTIVGAVEKMSRNGNEMIELEIEIGEKEGKCWEYLVNTEAAQFKMDCCLRALGWELREGMEVELDASRLLGLQGEAQIKIGKNDKGDERNELAFWIEPSVQHKAPAAAPSVTSEEDSGW